MGHFFFFIFAIVNPLDSSSIFTFPPCVCHSRDMSIYANTYRFWALLPVYKIVPRPDEYDNYDDYDDYDNYDKMTLTTMVTTKTTITTITTISNGYDNNYDGNYDVLIKHRICTVYCVSSS